MGWSAEPKGVRWGMLKFGPKFDPPVDLPMYADPIQNAKAVQRFWAANIDLKKNSADEQVPSIPVGFLSAL